MVILGVMMDSKGSTDTSVRHRQEIAEGLFHKLQRPLTSKGSAPVKLKTWTTVVVAVAMHGCRSWHLTKEIMQGYVAGS